MPQTPKVLPMYSYIHWAFNRLIKATKAKASLTDITLKQLHCLLITACSIFNMNSVSTFCKKCSLPFFLSFVIVKQKLWDELPNSSELFFENLYVVFIIKPWIINLFHWIKPYQKLCYVVSVYLSWVTSPLSQSSLSSNLWSPSIPHPTIALSNW